MKSASSSLQTSSAMVFSLSSVKTLFFYQMGGKDRHALSLWTMTLGLIDDEEADLLSELLRVHSNGYWKGDIPDEEGLGTAKSD